jgi:ATP-dependent Lhr-like helicase
VGGVDAVYHVVDQLAATLAPASEWEQGILPARVLGYRAEWLDELTASGDVIWFGAGSLPSDDGWMGLIPADQAASLLPDPLPIDDATDAHAAVLNLFPEGAALLTRAVFDRLSQFPRDVVEGALWDLVWSGHLSNDSLAAVRRRVGPPHARGSTRTRTTSPRRTRRQAGRPTPRLPADHVPGRWYLVPGARDGDTVRAHATAESLLLRHGVVTRGVASSEQVNGGYAALYRVLAAMENTGHVRRGYFVEGLGAAQFGAASAVDDIRRDPPSDAHFVLAATDPANPYGAALPWPASPVGHLPGRKAAATITLDAHGLVLFVERGGKTMLTWADPSDDRSGPAVGALVEAVRAGRRPPLHLQKIDGIDVHQSPWRATLVEAGFLVTPRGLRLRQRPPR